MRLNGLAQRTDDCLLSLSVYFDAIVTEPIAPCSGASFILGYIATWGAHTFVVINAVCRKFFCCLVYRMEVRNCRHRELLIGLMLGETTVRIVHLSTANSHIPISRVVGQFENSRS
jgi:hypothetical protein